VENIGHIIAVFLSAVQQPNAVTGDHHIGVDQSAGKYCLELNLVICVTNTLTKFDFSFNISFQSVA